MMNLDWPIASMLARSAFVLLVFGWMCRNWSGAIPESFIGYWLHMTPFLLMIYLMGVYIPILWAFLACFMAVFGTISVVTRINHPTCRPHYLPKPICRVRCKIRVAKRWRKRVRGELLPANWWLSTA